MLIRLIYTVARPKRMGNEAQWISECDLLELYKQYNHIRLFE